MSCMDELRKAVIKAIEHRKKLSYSVEAFATSKEHGFILPVFDVQGKAIERLYQNLVRMKLYDEFICATDEFITRKRDSMIDKKLFYMINILLEGKKKELRGGRIKIYEKNYYIYVHYIVDVFMIDSCGGISMVRDWPIRIYQPYSLHIPLFFRNDIDKLWSKYRMQALKESL